MKLSEIARENIDDQIRYVVNQELDRTAKVWKDTAPKMLVKNDSMLAEARKIETDIPGHPAIDPDEPAKDQFIAFVVDMRESTNHLIQAISPKRAKVSGPERVLYETAALLAAAAEVVQWQTGSVTEYLGDGVLALFRASSNRDEACYAACRAARKVVGDMRDIVNEALMERYKLPPLDLGVGMAYSEAVVTVVGHPYNPAPKAFGTCVYHASKLAGGVNEVVVDDNLEAVWPKAEAGRGFRFSRRTVRGIDGYILPPKAN